MRKLLEDILYDSSVFTSFDSDYWKWATTSPLKMNEARKRGFVMWVEGKLALTCAGRDFLRNVQ